MKADRVQCHCCEGRGTVPLSGVYAETLAGVRRRCKAKDDFVIANRDATWFGCKATTLNNRLAALERHGLLFSEKYGRQRRFFLCVVSGKGQS